jgi:hypothetical protein
VSRWIPLVAVLVLAPSPASAETTRDRGVTFIPSLGLNGCTGERCENLAPMLHLRMNPGFRIFRFLQTGVHVAFLFQGPLFEHADERTELWDFLVGPEVRGILPIKRLDIWLGIAFGYMHRRRLVESDDHEQRAFYHAIGLAWGGGVDAFLVPGRIALGGDIWIYRGWNREFCSTSGDSDEICSTANNVDKGTGYSIAVGASLTFFFPIGGAK